MKMVPIGFGAIFPYNEKERLVLRIKQEIAHQEFSVPSAVRESSRFIS